MIKNLLIFLLIAGIYLFIGAGIQSVSAQDFKLVLDSPGQTINPGSTFKVNIMINTGGQQVISGDALVRFDPAKLTIQSGTTGNFFTYYSASPLGGTTDRYLFSSWEESIAHAKTASTDTLFYTATVKAEQPGTTTLQLDCTPGTEADTNISSASDSKDIVNCSSLQPLTITVAGSTNPTGALTITPTVPSPTQAQTIVATMTPIPPTITPIPTATPTLLPTNTPTPTLPIPTVSELPRAGMFEMTAVAAGIGILLTVVGIMTIL